MMIYREVSEYEITRLLFSDFIRRQAVRQCRRRENGAWVLREAPFLDDWDEADYKVLVTCLRRTVRTGGFVFAAFQDDALKGFVSVESGLFGGVQRYLDLSSLHVSEDLRHTGIGTALFTAAKDWARRHGAHKLYISAHSAAETQAFYQKMGCTDAVLYNRAHSAAEPFDCQLECPLFPAASTDEPQYRHYRSSDCKAIAQMFYETVHTVNAADYSPAQLDAWASGTVDLKAWNESFSAHHTIVATQGGQIVGFGDIDADGYLDCLYVHKDFQRQGIATALCACLESVASETVTTYASVTAKPFFEKRGYRVQKAQTVTRQGISLPRFQMQKEL